MAEEIFQTGVIPSDTDYRIFVAYGNLVGKLLNYITPFYLKLY